MWTILSSFYKVEVVFLLFAISFLLALKGYRVCVMYCRILQWKNKGNPDYSYKRKSIYTLITNLEEGLLG